MLENSIKKSYNVTINEIKVLQTSSIVMTFAVTFEHYKAKNTFILTLVN